MSGWTVAWLLWLVMLMAIELPAILNKSKNDTLSEHVWKWGSIKDKSRGWKLRRSALFFFLVWLSAHFLTGGWV